MSGAVDLTLSPIQPAIFDRVCTIDADMREIVSSQQPGSGCEIYCNTRRKQVYVHSCSYFQLVPETSKHMQGGKVERAGALRLQARLTYIPFPYCHSVP